VRRLQVALAAMLALAGVTPAQPPAPPPEPIFRAPNSPAIPPVPPPTPDASPIIQELERHNRELERLRAQQDKPADAQDVDRLRKQVDLLQKQIEVLQKMAALLADQVKKSDVQTATLEARSVQAAHRDQTLAGAVDDLRDSADSAKRTGPDLPATLRELVNPFRNNESPLGIYGTFAAQFEKFEDRPSNFPSPVFSPHFYLLLNERLLLEVNPEFRGTQVELESCQVDWFVHDNFTLVAGRFYSPIGWFNERMHTSWIFKTPDRPLMFSQVLPASLSFNGLMGKGAVPVFDGPAGPVLVEYSATVTNGFTQDEAQPDARDFANLAGMSEAFTDVNGDKAFGGRIGFRAPAIGVWAGVSALRNGDYDVAGRFDLDVLDADFNWRYGNWDVRSEFARTNQDAPGGMIHRRGFYGQVAYRPYDACSTFLQNLEGLFRYDYVRFGGIDPAVAAQNFGSRELSPIGRNRYTFGMNYYPYPSLIVKLAYEINDEVQFRDLSDNGVIAQVAWGF
jgi:hypothetical protein